MDSLIDDIEKMQLTEAEQLLFEWYKWWWNFEDAPTKIGAGLHIRTAIYFTEKKYAQSPSTSFTVLVVPLPGREGGSGV